MNRPVRRQQPETSPEFRKYFKLVLRNWYWLVISLGVSLGTAKLINVLTPRTYRVSCEIAVGEKESSSVSNAQLVGGMDFNEANPINKEIGVLKSRNLAEQTVRQLNFNFSYYELIRGTHIKRRRYSNIPFRIALDSTDYLPINTNIYLRVEGKDEFSVWVNGDYQVSGKVKLNSRFRQDGISFSLISVPSIDPGPELIGREYLFYLNSQGSIVNEFWRKLQVRNSQTSQNILILSLDAENIYQAMAYLQKLYEVYDSNDLALRNRNASNTIRFIDNQLKILTAQLQQAEDSLIKFKRQHKIIHSGMEQSATDEFLTIERNYQDAQLELHALHQMQQQLDTIAEGENIVLPVLFTLSDSRLSAGIERINEHVITRELLLKNQNKVSPAVIKVNQLIQVEAEALRSYLDEQIEIIGDRAAKNRSELEQAERELMNLPLIERQLAKLTRDFELTENLYDLYQQKRIEARLAEASTASNVRMLDPPDKESAIMVRPRKSQNLQIAALLGLTFPVLLIILIELITNKVRDMHEVSAKVAIPVVGKLNHSKSNIYLPTEKYPWAAITESFRTLHAKLKYMLIDESQKIIAVTSGTSGDGKTFCAMNLAQVMAAAGNKTLLIGLDLRRPKIHEVYQLSNDSGLTTYLIGNNSLEETILPTNTKNLFLINSGPVPPNPVELIENDRMQKLMTHCRNSFDYVIVDSPPVGLVADALLLSKFIDLYLFIVRIDFTKKQIVQLLQELDENKTLQRLSLVFNDLKSPAGYRHNYGKYNNYYQKEDIPEKARGFLRKILRRS